MTRRPGTKKEVGMSEAEASEIHNKARPEPSSPHGVCRLILEFDGEVVERVDPQSGWLHRGTEKLIETRDLCRRRPTSTGSFAAP